MIVVAVTRVLFNATEHTITIVRIVSLISIDTYNLFKVLKKNIYRLLGFSIIVHLITFMTHIFNVVRIENDEVRKNALTQGDHDTQIVRDARILLFVMEHLFLVAFFYGIKVTKDRLVKVKVSMFQLMFWFFSIKRHLRDWTKVVHTNYYVK